MGAEAVSVEAKGIKEITEMFKDLPRQVNKDLVWGRFWKKVTVPLLDAAINEAPLLDPGTTGRVGVSYNRTKGEKKDGASTLTIARGTLKKSLIFFRTKASKEKGVHGAYIGPSVKGKFKKNKGGFFGAWVEYGHRNRDGSMSKPNPYMQRAWNQAHGLVLSDGFSEAEKIFIKANRAHVNRLKKHGRWGY